MAKEEIAAWTIMVYLAGDNNLTFALTEMRGAALSNNPANKSTYEDISDRSPRNGIADRRMLFEGDTSKRKVCRTVPDSNSTWPLKQKEQFQASRHRVNG